MSLSLSTSIATNLPSSPINECEHKELLLDVDKKLYNVLIDRGFESVSKLNSTLQGSVWRAKYSFNNLLRDVVIKIASKLYTNQIEDINQEINALKYCRKHNISSSIIEFYFNFSDNDNYYFVMEYGGCELFKFINECHINILNGLITIKSWQTTMRNIMYKLLNILDNLHKYGIAHLDISFENILISNIKWIQYRDHNDNCLIKKRLSNDFNMKLCDFGASKLFDLKKNKHFRCNHYAGKPVYSSPQIYGRYKSFNASLSDIWSFGVCLFVGCTGSFPWQIPSKTNNLFKSIVIDKRMIDVLKYGKKYHYVSCKDDIIIDLLNKIFVIDETKRISIQDIKIHKYFANNVNLL